MDTKMKIYLYGLLLAVVTMSHANATLISADVSTSVTSQNGAVAMIQGFDTRLGTLNSVQYMIVLQTLFKTEWTGAYRANAQWNAIIELEVEFNAPGPIGRLFETEYQLLSGSVSASAPSSTSGTSGILTYNDKFTSGLLAYESDWIIEVDADFQGVIAVDGQWGVAPYECGYSNSPFEICDVTKSDIKAGLEAMSISVATVVYDYTAAAMPVPEPSTLAIFALGMIGLASRRFKKQS
jgi:hypothetical protein